MRTPKQPPRRVHVEPHEPDLDEPILSEPLSVPDDLFVDESQNFRGRFETITKQQAYENLATGLAPFAQLDALMCEQDPHRWRRVRELDDWLVRHQRDVELLGYTTVSLGVYQWRCIELRGEYDAFAAVCVLPQVVNLGPSAEDFPTQETSVKDSSIQETSAHSSPSSRRDKLLAELQAVKIRRKLSQNNGTS
jgi:hypothetical protein